MEKSPERFGPFVLLRRLGLGGMGTAHLAICAGPSEGPLGRSERPVEPRLLVVKRLHPALIEAPTVLDRFVHEAEVATHVRHPNVAEMVAMGAVSSEPFLATEFVFGVQLAALVDRIESGVTPKAPLGAALHVGVGLASGLRAIHEAVHRETGEHLGLLHRDIGARNVLVGYDGGPRIIDLGLGKSSLSDWQTSHEVLAGSPDYMPPEQALGARVDARADVYALAVTLWELIGGQKRIREESVGRRIERCISAQPEPLRSIRPDASRRLEALLFEAMRPEPELRLPSAALLEEGLRAERDRIRSGADDAAVAGWLDSACATLRAKEIRALETDLARARAALGEAASVHLYVGDFAGLARPALAAAPSDPPGSASPVPTPRGRGVTEPSLRGGWGGRPFAPRWLSGRAFAPRWLSGRAFAPLGSSGRAFAPRWLSGRAFAPRWLSGRGARPGIGSRWGAPLVSWRPQMRASSSAGASVGAMGVAFGLVIALAAGVTATLAPKPSVISVTPLEAEEESQAAPALFKGPGPSSPPEVLGLGASPRGTVRPEADPPRAEPRALKRSGRVDEARRRALVERIRRLRQRSFEIGFQREITRLSARLSGAGSTHELDLLERRIRRLEEEQG